MGVKMAITLSYFDFELSVVVYLFVFLFICITLLSDLFICCHFIFFFLLTVWYKINFRFRFQTDCIFSV